MVTVAPIQEREEEEKSQAREQMEIELSQELPVVDHIPALHRRVIGVDLLDFLLFFLFGHGWRERSEQGVMRDYIGLEVDGTEGGISMHSKNCILARRLKVGKNSDIQLCRVFG